MNFTFQAGCRCFVGKQGGDGPWMWEEWNAVAYDGFLARVTGLQQTGHVETQGDEMNMLMTQQHPTQYRAKAFLTSDALQAYVLENLWDRDFIAVAAPEMLPRDIQYKEAA